MKIIDLYLPSSHNFVLMGDTHMGSMMCTYDGITECMNDILSEKHTYAGHMGDFVEAIHINDNRFDYTADDPIPLRQAKRGVKVLTPIAHRLKFGLLGNHEYALQRFGNLSLWICEELTSKCRKYNNSVRYGTYSAVINVSDKHGLIYRMFVTHGYYLSSSAKDPIQRKANMMANLKHKLENKYGQAVVMAMGHCHKLLSVQPDELYLKQEDNRLKGRYLQSPMGDIEYIPPSQRYYFATGSFSRLYTDDTDSSGESVSGYAERAGYDPVNLGYCKIHVEDRQITKVEEITV